jgi:hypothetical protein
MIYNVRLKDGLKVGQVHDVICPEGVQFIDVRGKTRQTLMTLDSMTEWLYYNYGCEVSYEWVNPRMPR